MLLYFTAKRTYFDFLNVSSELILQESHDVLRNMTIITDMTIKTDDVFSKITLPDLI